MAKPRIKLKLRCAAILDRATVPQAVLCADIRIGKESATYVLIDHETRDALSRMRRDSRERDRGAWDSDYGPVLRMREDGPFPTAIRSHAFDSSGLIHDDRDGDGRALCARQGTWSSAEALWIRADLAPIVLGDLDGWRECFPAKDGCIHAPNWLALVGVQSLAIAAGLPMPGPCGMGLDHPEVRA